MPEDYLLSNRTAWDGFAADFVEPGHTAWSTDEVKWGIFGIPNAEIGLLLDVQGLDAVELGCGTGYVSAWLARRGARPVGIDNSAVQLATAQGFQDEFDLHFPLIQGDAQHTPFPDASFDFAVSEYGAAIWCDPYIWIPEAARLLRPGGRLEFLGHSPLVMICTPEGAEHAGGRTSGRSAASGPVRDASLRLAGLNRVRRAARRDDPVAARLRLRDRGPDRDPSPRRWQDRRPVGRPRVGSALALRGHLEGPQAMRLAHRTGRRSR